MEEKEEIVIGFDFECAGGVPSENGFTQLGASVHERSNSNKIGGFNEYANMKDYFWETRCVTEFWEKNPERYADTLTRTSSSTMTCKQVIDKFIVWIREVSKDRKAVVLSDNMIYDGGLLKYYSGVDIMYLLGRRTVYFETSSVYYGMYALSKRMILNQDSDDLSSKKIALEAIGKDKYPASSCSHDHHPENDAQAMVEKWIFIMNNL